VTARTLAAQKAVDVPLLPNPVNEGGRGYFESASETHDCSKPRLALSALEERDFSAVKSN